MPDPLEDRLRRALHQAAGDIPTSATSSPTRAELLTGLARRRKRAQRRRGATLGTLAVVALAGIGAAVALPGRQPPRTSQALTVAGRSSSGKSSTGKRSSPYASSGAKSPHRAPTTAIHAGIPTLGLQAGGQSLAARHSPTSPSVGSSSTSPTTVIYPSGTGDAVPIGGTAYPQIGPPASTSTTIITPPLSAMPYVVTGSDSGETIDLAVGQSLEVNLSGSGSLPWTEPTSTNSGVMTRGSGSANPSTGDAYGQFRAVTAGQAQIVAAANPTCLKFGCEIPSRVWSVTVIVGS